MPVFFKPAFQITTAKTLRDSVTVLHDNLRPLGGLVAQLVEQCPFKALVQGSSPCQPTSLRPKRSEDEGCHAEVRPRTDKSVAMRGGGLRLGKPEQKRRRASLCDGNAPVAIWRISFALTTKLAPYDSPRLL
jgi:hypothetical protein